jgi:2-dehydropantoate 2-reductase
VRFVIFGAGAIGGVVGANLHRAGFDVLLIARGAHHDAIAAGGLTLVTPLERVTLQIPVARTPPDAALEPGDAVLLCTKSQDTAVALAAVRDSGGPGIPIVCLQNGVENERVAARRFRDVYGAVVMSPTAHLEPGVVQSYGTKLAGAIDIGRYPTGVDERCGELCEALAASRFSSDARADIMRHKHAKLIANLGNAVQAICGLDGDANELTELARQEGRVVLQAAGIECEVDDVADIAGRWQRWGVEEIAGQPRGGGSSWQSVVRGLPSIESDYLNGEIVLRGRQGGVPTPVNSLLQSLANETVRDGHSPGWLSSADVLSRL